MLKHILFSLLLLFSITAKADYLEEFHNKTFQARQAEMTDSQRGKSLSGPAIEAFAGCDIAKETQIRPFYDPNSEYKCQESENIFNNGSAKILRYALLILTLALVIPALYLLHKAHLFELFSAALGRATGHNVSSGNILALIASISLIPFIPAKLKDMDEELWIANHISLAEFSVLIIIQAIDSSTIAFNSELYKNQPLAFPSVDIANPKKQKFQAAHSLIDFAICSASQPGTKASQIDVFFNDQDGTYTGTTQVGGCVLEVSAQSDQSLQAIGQEIGFDYNAMAAKAFGQSLQRAADRAAAVGNAIAQRSMPLPDTTPTPYDSTRLIRGHEGSYNVSGMDSSGRAELARDAALLIGEDLTQELTRFPGLDESSVPAARTVQMCRYLPGATTYTDPSLSLTDNLKACAASMCADSSSPTLCGQSLGFYQMYSTEDLQNPNTITQFSAIAKTKFFGGNFQEAGKGFVNSITVESTFSNTSEGAFERPIGKKVFEISIPKGEASYEYDPLIKSPIVAETVFEFSGDVGETILKLFESGNSGILGLNAFHECLANPYTIRENGLVCGNALQTLHQLGMNWLALGTNIKISLMVNNLTTKTPLEKNKSKAAIGTAIKELESNSKMASISGFFFKVIASTLSHYGIENVFAKNGADFSKEDILLLSVAYAVPVFNTLVGSIGSMLIGAAYFLMFAPILTIGLAILSMCLNILMTVVVKLRIFADMIRTFNSGNYENQTGFFKPFNDIIVFVLGLFMFCVTLQIGLNYIQSIFTFQFMDFSTIFTHHGQAPTFTDFNSVIEGFLAALMFILMVLIVVGAVLKFSLNPQTIINMLITAQSEDDEIYKDSEISSQKDLI